MKSLFQTQSAHSRVQIKFLRMFFLLIGPCYLTPFYLLMEYTKKCINVPNFHILFFFLIKRNENLTPELS